MESGVYQQPAQPQAQYVSPVYMQQVYSPQQEFPIYPVVSPTWSPSVVPHFETPLVRTINFFLWYFFLELLHIKTLIWTSHLKSQWSLNQLVLFSLFH